MLGVADREECVCHRASVTEGCDQGSREEEVMFRGFVVQWQSTANTKLWLLHASIVVD